VREAWWSLQLGIRAELETTTKNESENDHFCKNGGGRIHFSKNDHFRLLLMFIF